MCGRPTTHVYRAYGGGYMALCKKHARGYSDAWPIQEVDEVTRSENEKVIENSATH
jgi:hypothetical protein